MDDFDQPGVTNSSEAIETRLGSAVGVDSLGNPLQQTLSLRGFAASPVLGEPQGVTVFQGPMRLNEAFGDVVAWDLLPVFAIDQAQIVTGSNPLYGLNTTGGIVALDMKNGFNAPGLLLEAGLGSFGTRSAMVQAGGVRGATGFYFGADHLSEDGWRDASPSRLTRAFADLTWRPSEEAEIGLSLTAADTDLTGNGPAPEDLLAARREAVFTSPDETDSRLYAATAGALFTPREGLSVGAGAFVRDLTRRTRNGDQAEFTDCEAFAGLVPDFSPPPGTLCFGAEIEGGEVEGDPEIVVGRSGAPVTEVDDVEAVFNRTRTETLSAGASAQATWTATLEGRDNILVAGAAFENARSRYASGSDLGEFQADRSVASLGVVIGNPAFNVGLKTRSRTYGLYLGDTFSITPSLHVSGALRWNRVELRLRDQIGQALTGDHVFERLNPGAGLAWNVSPATTTYVSYAENNRAPTPAELSCADPETPCRFPNAFLSDPPLEDVKARTWETGARGGGAELQWSAALFRTDLSDDIVFVSAGPIVGSGFFQNVGDTRRDGVEADLLGEQAQVSWFASYAYVRATYQTALQILAPDNPQTDDQGEIAVSPGDRIPGQPLHSFRAGADWEARPDLTVGADLLVTSDRFLRGDEANLEKPLAGFAVVGVNASWQRGPVEIWGRIENLFDAEYKTFGVYGDPEELGFHDPRFVSPGPPRGLFVGLRATL